MKIPNCAICEKPTTLATAVVEVDASRAFKQMEDERLWNINDRKKKGIAEGGFHFVQVGKMPYESSVPWQWNHADCGPDMGYWFDASRISSPEQALNWTLHLGQKNWIHQTDWDTFVRELGFVAPD